ncbi:hypothetical protein BGZ73_004914 [Actinomortierella ambigua]|nr:hypothetical protein BGZ73_004914 [Actinomortierella ambigua]
MASRSHIDIPTRFKVIDADLNMDVNPAIAIKELHQQVSCHFDLKNPPLSMTALETAVRDFDLVHP